MIKKIRTGVGEGDCLDKDDLTGTAFRYSSSVSKADGIQEMMTWATDVKDEDKEEK